MESHSSQQGGSVYERPNTLPRYSTLSLVPLPVYPAAGELDISASADPLDPGRKEAFEFCLTTGSGSKARPWATLRLFSHVPLASLKRPRYVGGEDIEGTVVLDLKNPQTIYSISVLLRGRMITSSLVDGSYLFLERGCSVLGIESPSANDNIRPSASSPGPGDPPSPTKLQGHHEFPFSIAFPPELQVDSTATATKRPSVDSQPQSSYTTPQTVLERGFNANIVYEVIMKITSGGPLMRTKDRATANILYVPFIRSLPLPPLRAGAYLNGAFLVGPQEDPSGWQALPPIRANLISASNVGHEIECSVFIANPTTYTRGTVIPCYLLCKCTDQDALHAFTSQRCLSLTLFQRVLYFQDAIRVTASIYGFKTGKQARDDRNTYLSESGSAVWWAPESVPSTDIKSDLRAACLEGEIHLDVGLLPSSQAPFLSISHFLSVSLSSSQDLDVIPISEGPSDPSSSSAAAAAPTGRQRRGTKGKTAPVSSLPGDFPSFDVTITTAHGKGSPIPIPFTPRPTQKKKDLSTIQEPQYQLNSFSARLAGY